MLLRLSNPHLDRVSESVPLRFMLLGFVASVFIPFILTAGIVEFELTPIWRAEFQGVLPADLDGDGVDELIMSRKQAAEEKWGISVTNLNNDAMWQYWSGNKIEAIASADVDGDDTLEILVREKVADTAFLLIFNQDRKLLKRIRAIEGRDIDNTGEWDGTIGYREAFDVNGDGNKELLLVASTGHDLQPRGILLLDPETGRILWFYRFGFYPKDVEVADLDGDGDVEIVLGSSANANGSEANGTDDFHTYVVAIDHKGQFLWQRQIGGYFSATWVNVVDFDSDGVKEVVVVEATQRADYEGPDRIMILDGSTGDTEKVVKTGHAYRGVVLCDLDRDSIPEIVVGNKDGVVRAFDKDLQVVSEFEYGGEISVFDADDLDGDGYPEISATNLIGDMYVLNHNLKLVGTLETNEGCQTAAYFVSDGETKKILMQLSQPSGELEYIMFDVESKISQSTKFLLFFVPLLTVLLVISGSVFMLLYRRTKLFRRSLNKSSHGIILLSRKGKVRVMNDAARKILGLKKETRLSRPFASLDIEPQLEESKKVLSGSIRLEEPRRVILTKEENGQKRRIEIQTFKAGAQVWLVSLTDITEQEFGRRVATLIPVAQQLAHGIKNPLNHIRLAIQRLQSLVLTGKRKQSEAARYSGMVADEAERLIKLTDGFMRFTKLDPPEFKPVSIKWLIENVVDRFRQILPKGVDLEIDAEEDLPEIMIDPEQISIVIDHLVDNAISAVGNKGKIIIEVHPVGMKGDIHSVEIKIKDTGTGIPKKYHTRVFEPYFSLKEGGTGLGLAMVKKIVNDHEGTISLESTKGRGTTIIVTLPASKEK